MVSTLPAKVGYREKALLKGLFLLYNWYVDLGL